MSARTWLGIWSSCYPLPPTGFQDQDCERTAWEAEEGWLEDQASFPKVLGVELHIRECSLYQLDCFDYWL